MRKSKRFGIFLIVIALLLGTGGAVLYQRPIPALAGALVSTSHIAAAPVPIPWPTYGEAALGAKSYGVIATNGRQTPVPTASVAKIMTALAVLQKRPLNLGEQGPTLTLTESDQALFDKYYAEDGSLVKIAIGEKISEYQALEAMLLPSANNMADTLANWAFGSVPNYTVFATTLARSYGMYDTTIADASGFSPETVSTASDIVKLGEASLANPIIAQIVNEKSATIPIAGPIANVNWQLGFDGINGIKTGNTDQAGGVFLGSAQKKLTNGQTVTLISAVMEAPTLEKALNDTPALLDAAATGFSTKTLVTAGENMGAYTTPWNHNKTIDAVASKSISFVAWDAANVTSKVQLQHVNGPLAKGSTVGSISVMNATHTTTVPIILAENMSSPSLWWRITHY